jgi:TldD protein
VHLKPNDIARIVREQLAATLHAGSTFADARFFAEDWDECLVYYDGNLENNAPTRERGIGVRVLREGTWGFAASADLTEIPACFNRARANAEAAARLPGFRKDLGPPRPRTGSYRSPAQQDPIDLPLTEKADLLRAVDERLKGPPVAHRQVFSHVQRRHVYYWNSEGSEFDRCLVNTFAWMKVLAPDKEGRMQRRSHKLFTPGSGTRGWELLANPTLFADHAERVKQELAELLVAERLPHRRCDVILLPAVAWLQVHETIGHALELDRILGYELSYAGGSHVRPEQIGTLRYGSEKLNARAGIVENSSGTFGFDDEGSPQRDYLLIDKGVLVNVLSSRSDLSEVNTRAGRTVVAESGAAARSCAFSRPPIDRMTNINIDPGNDGTLDDIIKATADGIVFDSATTPSIGSNREHFHITCEIAWEVKDGQRRRVFKNPTYQGHTLEFWNSLDKVGDQSTWHLQQVDSCGKGEPNQIMELGHGVPVLRFRNVETGEAD